MLDKIWERLIKLIDLKSIITLAVVIAMIIFTAYGIISNEVFISTASMVIIYYFSKKNNDNKGE